MLKRLTISDVKGETGSVLPLSGRALTFARSGRLIIDDASLTLEPASGTTAILGPNGAGKSVLLRLLADLVAADGGEVLWAGRPPDRSRCRRLGFVFQRPVLLRRSVLANVEFVLARSGLAAQERADAAMAALEAAGLASLANAPARALSGGEQQRLAVARALVVRPEVLMLDEPTSNLDPASMQAIEDLIGRAAAAGTSIVLITQDMAQARRLADRVVFMHRGRILERTDAKAFFATPQRPEAAAFIRGDILL